MNIYIYDDTFEGLLTAIYDIFYSRETTISLYGKSVNNSPLLLGETIEIITDKNKFKKVKYAIIDKIDYLSLKKIYLVYLSNHKEKAMIIYRYLKIAFKLGHDTHNFLNIDVIRMIDNISRQVSHEGHKFEGFVRFSFINDKFLYSSIEPDNDILELLGDHFQNRFPKDYFIIHDIHREKALIYNRHFYEIKDLDKETYEKLNCHTDEYADLWKAYFKSTTIDERKNLKLQRKLVPKRYWKHILEI